MSAEISTFQKNDKTFPVIVLKRDVEGKKTFPFQFGVGKAKLILEHLEDIKNFVKQYGG